MKGGVKKNWKWLSQSIHLDDVGSSHRFLCPFLSGFNPKLAEIAALHQLRRLKAKPAIIIFRRIIA
jgi:hypothetical protein